MSCPFKVGETYQTKCGFRAIVDAQHGDMLIGRVCHDPAQEGGWLAHSWGDTGWSRQKSGGYDPKDFQLIEAKKEIWVAVCRHGFSEEPQAYVASSEEAARGAYPDCIAVLGPVKIEDVT